MKITIVLAAILSFSALAEGKKEAVLSTDYKKSLVWQPDLQASAPEWRVEVIDFSSKFKTPMFLKKLILAVPEEPAPEKSDTGKERSEENAPESSSEDGDKTL